jgi:hypothetical protein
MKGLVGENKVFDFTLFRVGGFDKYFWWLNILTIEYESSKVFKRYRSLLHIIVCHGGIEIDFLFIHWR